MRFWLTFVLFSFFSFPAIGQISPVYFALQTQDRAGDGIYVSYLDTQAGTLSEPKRVTTVVSPYYFLDLQEESILYAVCEGEASLIAFQSSPNELKQLTPQVRFENGAWLCQMTKWRDEMLVNCYGNRSIARVTLGENGAPVKICQQFFFEGNSVHPHRQKKSHPHSINVGPNGLVYVCDLGSDKIWILRWSEAEGERKLTPNEPFFVTTRPGSGPRHMVFHPTLPVTFVDNELTNDVTVYQIQTDGSLKEIQTIATVPVSDRGKNFLAVSEIRLTSHGKFLYVANRGHDSITAFRVEEDGKLTFLETEPSGGKCPRAMLLDASNRFLVVPNRISGTILLMKIAEDGTLSPTECRFSLPGEIPGAAILKATP